MNDEKLTAEDVTTPVWPYIVMGILFSVFLFTYVTNTEPSLSDEEISQQVEKIKEINIQTFEDIKVKYNLIYRDDVEIEYSTDGNVDRVKDEMYSQDFQVTHNSELSDKEKIEELRKINNSYEFVNLSRVYRANKKVLSVTAIVPIFIFLFAFILNGLNKQNIKKLEKIKEEDFVSES